MFWKGIEGNNNLQCSSSKCHHSCCLNALNLEALELTRMMSNTVRDMFLESKQLRLK